MYSTVELEGQAESGNSQRNIHVFVISSQSRTKHCAVGRGQRLCPRV